MIFRRKKADKDLLSGQDAFTEEPQEADVEPGGTDVISSDGGEADTFENIEEQPAANVTTDDTAEVTAGSDLDAPDTEDVSELETLRREVTRLSGELKKREELTRRMEEEIGDFSGLFPDRKISEIPDGVWNDVRSGIPLAAAYSLYEKREEAKARQAGEVNRRNSELSSGSLGSNEPNEYFSPSEVRKMTREEVHANYSGILESMKRWN